jgi:hypothetical protein
MFNNFFAKKLLKSQMKNVPDEQIDMVMGIVEKNPELFQKIAAEIKTEMANGKDQMTASMEVMKKYEKELKELN